MHHLKQMVLPHQCQCPNLPRRRKTKTRKRTKKRTKLKRKSRRFQRNPPRLLRTRRRSKVALDKKSREHVNKGWKREGVGFGVLGGNCFIHPGLFLDPLFYPCSHICEFGGFSSSWRGSHPALSHLVPMKFSYEQKSSKNISIREIISLPKANSESTFQSLVERWFISFRGPAYFQGAFAVSFRQGKRKKTSREHRFFKTSLGHHSCASWAKPSQDARHPKVFNSSWRQVKPTITLNNQSSDFCDCKDGFSTL